MNSAYTLHYEVPATTKLEAIFAASALLRTGVRVEELVRVEPTVPGWWEVVLDVAESEPPEPIWFPDHPADATVESEYDR